MKPALVYVLAAIVLVAVTFFLKSFVRVELAMVAGFIVSYIAVNRVFPIKLKLA